MKDERLLREMAWYSIAIMLLILCIAEAIRQRPEPEGQSEEATPAPTVVWAVEPTRIPAFGAVAEGGSGHTGLEEVWAVWNILLSREHELLKEFMTSPCVIIRRQSAGGHVVSCSEELLTHSMRLVLSGEQGMTLSSVLRAAQGEYFVGTPVLQQRKEEAEREAAAKEREEAEEAEENAEESEEKAEESEEEAEEEEVFITPDPLEELGILHYEQDGQPVTELAMVWNGYYFAEVLELPEYYVVSLKRAKELYDRIVVVDAGHGGRDPGAGAENWRVKESQINLSILLYLKEYLDADETITAFYTRTEDTYPTLAQRVELANGLGADLFVSIHCNSTVQSRSNGTEVMYNAEQGVGEAFGSREFARLCLVHVAAALGTRSGGIVKRPDLHIVRRAEMPVALVETAYLSNEGDLEILKDKEKQRAAAEAIYRAILEAYERMGIGG